MAVLISLLDLQFSKAVKGVTSPQWLMPDDRVRYGLSADSWRVATQRLVALGLVKTGITEGAGRDFESRRRRKTYLVAVDRLNDDALEVEGSGWAPH
jgi:hypothetical protein